MRTIVLLSCVSKKKNYETRAADLYDSTLFSYSLQYANKQKPDQIFILSALYGLIELDKVIQPYNLTLNDMSAAEKKKWSQMVLGQMTAYKLNREQDLFIFLAGNNYRKYLLPYIRNYQIPLEGLRIGEQLSFLKRSTNL